MTADGTALAHALIEGELGRVPESDRGKVADQVLGALTSRFYFIPIPTAQEEAATRADLAAMDIPGLFGNATKGHS
jgi:hypothetical protein